MIYLLQHYIRIQKNAPPERGTPFTHPSCQSLFCTHSTDNRPCIPCKPHPSQQQEYHSWKDCSSHQNSAAYQCPPKNVNSRFIGQADLLFPKSLRLLYHIKSKKSIGISEKNKKNFQKSDIACMPFKMPYNQRYTLRGIVIP